MENLAKVFIVPEDYEQRKEQIIEAVITYLNYDSVSDERWHSPFSKERQEKVRKDAENIVELTMEYYKIKLN